MQLFLAHDKLEAIQSKGLAMARVVSLYLNRNYDVDKFGPPTWIKIVEAVRNPVGGDSIDEAEKISKKYIGMFAIIKFSLTIGT